MQNKQDKISIVQDEIWAQLEPLSESSNPEVSGQIHELDRANFAKSF